MKTFIVGLCLLLSVGVSWAGEESAATSRLTIVQDLAEQLVRKAMAGASITETLGILAEIDQHTAAIERICNRHRELQDYKRYRPCMEFYVGAARVNAIALLTTAMHAKDMGDKVLSKKLYRSVITTYTGPAYRSFVKEAEFALEDLKGT